MSHSVKVNIYLVAKNYYIIPTWYDNGGYLSILPIRIISVESSNQELGETILTSRYECKEGDTDYSQNSFKELLKLTKLRSESKLRKKAKYVTITFGDDETVCLLNRVDTSLKCFVGSDEDKHFHPANMDPDKIGLSIVNTFNEVR